MTKGSGKVSPYSIPGIIANLAAGQAAIAQGLKGELLHDQRVLERRHRHRRGREWIGAASAT